MYIKLYNQVRRIRKSVSTGLSLLCLCLVSLCCCKRQDGGNYPPIRSLEEYRTLRAEKLNKPRPVIHNNDGCDVLYFPIDEQYSVKNLLDKRTSGLIDSDVSTISICPTASGFGYYTHNTTVGELLLKHAFESDGAEYRNITAEMIAEGTDILQVNVDFARKNGFEVFWSNRMNDTHDWDHRKDKPHLLWTKFKENNPQFLFGDIGEQLPHGRWSSVDFEHQEVRDLCVQFFREVCENYDVDGVELDFLRHFEIFKTVGRGGYATPQQLDMLTDMVRQIRKVTEEAGMKRGNPILMLARVPTSPEYAEKAGVDIKKWIDEELVDIVAGSCYFRLDFWENFAKLGQGKNVKIYAGLSESRATHEHPLLVRQQNAVFRARAAAAWAAGLDGMYSFNQYNTRVKYLTEIGNPEKLKITNNLYFVTYRACGAEAYLKNGSDWFKMKRLAPHPYWNSKFGTDPLDFDIEIGDESARARVYVLTWTGNVKARDLTVKINGVEAKLKKAMDDGLSVFEIGQSAVKVGINSLSIDSREKKVKPGDDRALKDAAIFFCRDTNDIEMRALISTCNQ